MLRQALLGLAILSSCVAVLAQDGEVKLQLKFKAGETFWLEQVIAEKQDITFLDVKGGAKSDIKATTITKVDVKQVTPELVVFGVKFEDNKIECDGRRVDGVDEFLDKVKGATFIVTMTLDGGLKKVDGVADWILQLGLNDEEVKPMKDCLNDEMSDGVLKNLFYFSPDKTVKTADTWKRQSTCSVGRLQGIKLNATFTYKGKKGGREEIGSKITMDFAAAKIKFSLYDDLDGDAIKFSTGKKDGSPEVGDVALTDMEGERHGTYIFDAVRGRLASATTSMKMKFKQRTVDATGTELPEAVLMNVKTTCKVHDKNPLQK